jgi:hypothetical protein
MDFVRRNTVLWVDRLGLTRRIWECEIQVNKWDSHTPP